MTAPSRPPSPPSDLREPTSVTLVHATTALTRSPLFWVGLALRVCAAPLFGSHFATQWFAPFVYAFVNGHGADPWAQALSRGEVAAFPYGPTMLLVEALPFAPAALVDFDPAGPVGLFLLRVPLICADLLITLLLAAWAHGRVREVLLAWWLNPIALYASYVHGQLDVLPTALLCAALALTFQRRVAWGALALGAAVGAKLHLLLALPFAWTYVWRLQRPVWQRLGYGAVSLLVAAGAYGVPWLSSEAFGVMVFSPPEANRVWHVALEFGRGATLVYLCPAALLIVWLRFLSYRKLDHRVLLLFLGMTYATLVALVDPATGWFLWPLPFLAFQAARTPRSGLPLMALLAATYLLFYFVSDPVLVFEAAAPLVGEGTTSSAAAAVRSRAPWLFEPRGVGLAWTALCATTVTWTFSLYRHGVQHTPFYRFRDQPFMLGIAGDSAAGKHTLARNLLGVLGPGLLRVIDGDNDHRWERGHPMWTEFTHLDPRGNYLGAQAELLKKLKRGELVVSRPYDHGSGRFLGAESIEPADFVAIVGLHAFYLPNQRALLDLAIFVEPNESDRQDWKVQRDSQERGKEPTQVREEITRRLPDSARYIQPQRQHADLVLRPGNVEPSAPTQVSLDLTMANDLMPLELAERLAMVPTLRVDWERDEALLADRLAIRGEVTKDQVRRLVLGLGGGLSDSLIAHAAAWRDGTHGAMQLVVAACLFRRLDA